VFETLLLVDLRDVHVGGFAFVGGLAVGAGDKGGVELLDLAGGVLERAGNVLVVGSAACGSLATALLALGLALLGSLCGWCACDTSGSTCAA
jgi:hypothetical protein